MNRPCCFGGSWVLALILFVLGTPAGAVGLLADEAAPSDRLELLRHQVTATIKDGVAVTTVEQTFRHHGDAAIDALYTLPVPRTASITSYTLTVAGQEASGDGEDLTLTGGPGVGGDTSVLQLPVPLIPAGNQPTVRIVYAHRPQSDAAGWMNYVYPLAASTQPGAGDYVQGQLHLRVTVLSDRVAAMRSPSHRLEAQMTQAGEARHVADLTLDDGAVAQDFVLAYRLRDRQVTASAAPAVYQPATPKVAAAPAAPQPQVIVVQPQPQPEIVYVDPSPRRVYVYRDRPRVTVGTSMSFRIGDRSSLSIGRWDHYDRWHHRYDRHDIGYRDWDRSCDRRCTKRDHRHCHH